MNYWNLVCIQACVWTILALILPSLLKRCRAHLRPLYAEVTFKSELETEIPTVPSTHGRHIPRTQGLRRVLIIGAGTVGCNLARSLKDDGRYFVVGFVDDDIHEVLEGDFPVLGRRDQTLNIVAEYAIDEVILSYAPTWQQRIAEELLFRHPKVCVRIVPTAFEALMRMKDVESFGDIALVRLVTKTDGLNDVLKRSFDITSALFGLILLSPLMLLVAVLIRFTSRGPIIFAQERTGRFGKSFTLYKFRTMHIDAEAASGPVLAQGSADRRLTGIGKWLRLFRVDEIPQLWNVLWGEMSLVGPRPERPFFVRQFELQTPAYAQRHQVRPGITGLAQVCGGYHTDARDKLRFDLIYISHYSVWLDLSILLRTVLVVVFPRR